MRTYITVARATTGRILSVRRTVALSPESATVAHLSSLNGRTDAVVSILQKR